MSSLDSILRGSGGYLKSRASRGFFRTYVTSNAPSFPRSYFPALRDTSAITNALYTRIGARVLTQRPALQRSTLSLYEDRRQWHPDAIRPARSMTENYPAMGERTPIFSPDWYKTRPSKYPFAPRPSAPMRPGHYPTPNGPLPVWWPKSPLRHWGNPRVLEQARLAPIQYGFMNPRKVVICLKRKIRREIAHALGFAGKPNNKKPKYNFYSYVRC